jgi:hypothetical protein
LLSSLQVCGGWYLTRSASLMERRGWDQTASDTPFFDARAVRMCFLSMNPKRPQWKSEAAPTAEEGLSAIRGFGAYCVTIENHANEGFMLRHYEINQTPNTVGRATKRWYTFQGADRMSLRVDASELNQPVVENTFVWSPG